MLDLVHGSRSTFKNHGCKCDPCTEANNAYERDRYQGSEKVRTGKAARSRRYKLKKYGLTEDLYEEMLIAQGGVCAICKRGPEGKRMICVDHNHETGEVRGLLCTPCNLAVGNLQDNPDLADALAAYLRGN